MNSTTATSKNRKTLVKEYKRLLAKLCNMRTKTAKGHCYFIDLSMKQIRDLGFWDGEVYFVDDLIFKVKTHKGNSPQLHVYGFWSQVLSLFKSVCPGIRLNTPPSESEISAMIKANTQLFVNGLKMLRPTKVGYYNTVIMSNWWLTYVNATYGAIIAQEEKLFGEEAMLKERATADAGGSAAAVPVAPAATAEETSHVWDDYSEDEDDFTFGNFHKDPVSTKALTITEMGEFLYPRIFAIVEDPDRTGKITGMVLENSPEAVAMVIDMIRSDPSELQCLVDKANDVLEKDAAAKVLANFLREVGNQKTACQEEWEGRTDFELLQVPASTCW